MEYLIYKERSTCLEIRLVQMEAASFDPQSVADRTVLHAHIYSYFLIIILFRGKLYVHYKTVEHTFRNALLGNVKENLFLSDFF